MKRLVVIAVLALSGCRPVAPVTETPSNVMIEWTDIGQNVWMARVNYKGRSYMVVHGSNGNASICEITTQGSQF